MRLAVKGIELKLLDIAAFVIALAVIAFISVRVYAGQSGAPAVHVRGPSAEWIFPLDSTETLAVPGPLGDTIVEIKEGAARVLSSPCREKLCIKSGAIARPSQWIACLPNRVFVDIRGRGRDSPDATSF